MTQTGKHSFGLEVRVKSCHCHGYLLVTIATRQFANGQLKLKKMFPNLILDIDNFVYRISSDPSADCLNQG